MANTILIVGESGSGKSTAIRTLKPEETYIISVYNKDLPFPGWKKNYFPSTKEKQGNRKIIYDAAMNISNYQSNRNLLSNMVGSTTAALRAISDNLPNVKTIVIDDSQFFMGFEIIYKGEEKGFDKFTKLTMNFVEILQTASMLRPDIDVFFLHHVETTADGLRKGKTVGKMFDNYVTLEALFTVVLFTEVHRGDGKPEYVFVTNNHDGNTTAKSPMGMFPSDEIPNDLQLVKDLINKYNQGE